MTELMRRRRALMGRSAKTPRLPAAYQEVAWVGKDSNDPRIGYELGSFGPYTLTIVVRHDGGTGSGAEFFGRIFWSNPSNDFSLYFNSNAEIESLGNASIVSDIVNNGVHTCVVSVQTTENTGRFMLLSNRYGGSSFRGGIYSVKAENSNGTLFDFVPCCRKADSAIGFFDLVSETFKTSAYGSLTKGGNV